MEKKWTAAPFGTASWAVYGPDGDMIAIVYGNTAKGITAEQRAKQIVANPQMHAALEALDIYLGFDDDIKPGDLGIEDPSDINKVFKQAQVALAAARGEKGEG